MGGGGSPTDAGLAEAADGAVCDPDAAPPDTAMTACFQSGYCPPARSASARDQLSMALGLCDTSNFACCGETVIDEIPCGPSTSGGNCCYTVFTRPNPCNGDQGSSGGGGGPPGCLPNGQSCNLPTDCCSDQCNVDSLCGPVQCRQEGSFCLISQDCCQLTCVNPYGVAGAGGLCLFCIATGEPCSDAGPCCGGSCDSIGRCGGAPCAPDGTRVGFQGENCCSGNAKNGFCASKFCADNGAICTSIYDCCSGECNDYRCGDVACSLPGEPCVETSHCCIGECTAGTCGSSPGCVANGGACGDAGACCSNLCDPATGTCAVNHCLANEAQCTEDADCCSGNCIEDRCDAEP